MVVYFMIMNGINDEILRLFKVTRVTKVTRTYSTEIVDHYVRPAI